MDNFFQASEGREQSWCGRPPTIRAWSTGPPCGVRVNAMTTDCFGIDLSVGPL